MFYRLKVFLSRVLFRLWERRMLPTMMGGAATAGGDVFWLNQIMWLTRSIHVVAALKIPDMLAGGPMSCREIAAEAGCDEKYLYRVLRLLAAFDIFAEDSEGRFHLTRRARALQSDSPWSVRDWTVHSGDTYWDTATVLAESVKLGRPQDEVLWGKSYWEHLLEHPEQHADFVAGMDRWNDWHAAEVLAGYDFRPFQKTVDVGGGRGALTIAILKAHPHLRGVLYDQPATIEYARPRIEAAGLSDRCELIGGSFFTCVPKGGDVYLLKHVLHDWNDQRALILLRNIRDAMDQEARLLVINGVMQLGMGRDRILKLNDLLYMIEGGKVRTLSEFQELFQQAGLHLARIVTTRINDITILEVRKQ